ncbi:MAG: DUF1849 family protein [Alphaproteobacteria bacterium]|nr:DUF1849 family protein [Alphaproteobacteria bacterium]
MLRKSATPFLTALVLAGSSLWSAAAAEPVRLVPYTATYSLHLLETRVGDIAAVDGSMDISVIRGCEAWTSQNQLTMSGGAIDNPSIEVDAESMIREDLEGRWMEFESSVRVGGNLQEAISGRAELDEDGRGTATFKKPREVSFPLPKGTTFPITAARDAIDRIWNDGARLVNYLMFDGESPSPMRGTDIVAGTPDPISRSLDDPDKLVQGDLRRIVTTLFEFSDTDSEPQTTYIVDMLPNGIASRLTVDMGFMVVESRLIEITAVPEPNC